MIAGMEFTEKLGLATGMVRSHHVLLRGGETKRGLASRMASGELIRLRRGWYVQADSWHAAFPEVQHLAAIRAASLAEQHGRTYSHRSAATLHDLPVWSAWMRGRCALPDAARMVVHALARGADSGSRKQTLALHRSAADRAETTTVAGYVCTSVDRTLADIAATEPFTVALACADILLARESCKGRSVDAERVQIWRERVRLLAMARSGRPGVTALRVLAEVASPQSESPLESVSRLRCLQLGLEPEQQVPVRSERGGLLHLDFLFRGIGFFGECDGAVKYTDERYRRGNTADEVFEAERRRHNWISGSTGLRGIRWGATHAATVDGFARRLREFSVPFSGTPTTAYGPVVAGFLRKAV